MQVVVYTGAVMMLFLFVLMLVGVDSSDSLVETIKGQRWARCCSAIGLAALLVAASAGVTFGASQPAWTHGQRRRATSAAMAELIFSQYVWTFEVTSALLITAALGAMVLAHRERLDAEARPSASWPQRARPRRAATSPACRRPVSTPATTRSTPRPCCPTARRAEVSRIARCSPRATQVADRRARLRGGRAAQLERRDRGGSAR